MSKDLTCPICGKDSYYCSCEEDDDEYLNKLIDQASGSWKDVDDPTAFVRELRGDIE